MKVALVIAGNDPETVWNAFRFGVFALGQDDEVSAFLLGKGVEAERIGDERFAVRAVMEEFVAKGGRLLACGSCLELRAQKSDELCPVSTMRDLHALVAESDRVLTF